MKTSPETAALREKRNREIRAMYVRRHPNEDLRDL